MRATELATGDEDAARELRRALRALEQHDPQLERRLGDRVDALADRVSTLARTVSTTAAALAGKDGELARLRRELEAGRGRVEELAADLGRELDRAGIEELRRTVASLARDVSARRDDALMAELDTLRLRLNSLAATVAATASGLAGREGELAALRRRLDAVAAAPSAPARPEHREPGADAVTAEEVAKLRILLDGLRLRVARTEKQLAAHETPDGVEARLDELARRLEALEERVESVPAPVPGDGRFRLDLRALELEFGRTQSTARESREAVLARIERLAQRMEWRLRRLESARARAAEERALARTGTGGDVVPLRGEE